MKIHLPSARIACLMTLVNLLLVTSICIQSNAVAQIIAPPNLSGPSGDTYPNQTYYLALNLYREGRFEDAMENFQRAIRLGRTTVNGKAIDSIPAMAMLGECWYQRGDLLLAQEQFDTVFQIMIREDGWISLMQWPPGILPNSNSAAGIMPRGNRAIIAGQVPTTVSMSIGAVDQTAAIARGTIQSMELLPIDAVEILRGVAIALYRRAEILGPLNVDETLVERMGVTVGAGRQPAGWPQSIVGTLTGLALSLDGQNDAAAATLRNAISLPGGLDHPLSPIARIALARLVHQSGQIPVANQLIVDATTSAAIWHQPEWLAEALTVGVGPAVMSQTAGELHTSATAATLAMGRDFRSAAAQSNLVAAELAMHSGKLDEAVRRIKDTLPLFNGRRAIGSPRLHAYGQYVSALASAMSGRSSDAVNSLSLAMKFAGGTPQSAASPRLYQLARVQLAARNSNLGDLTTEKYFDTLLDTSAPSLWYRDPLDALALHATDLSPYYLSQLEIARRQAKDAKLAERGDQLLRHLVRRADPFGGRLYDIRWLCGADPTWLTPALQTLRQKPPAPVAEIVQAAIEANKLADQLASIPMGDIKFNAQRREVANRVVVAADVADGFALRTALMRQVIPHVFPPAIDGQQLLKSIPEDGALLAYLPLTDQIIGLLATNDGIKTWQIPSNGLPIAIQNLIASIGINGKPAAANRDWHADAAALSGLLLPKDWKLPEGVRRIVFVPCNDLWMVPFELLSSSSVSGPMLGERAVCSYAATLGLAIHPVPHMNRPGTNGCVANRLLSPRDIDADARQVQELLEAAKPALLISADNAGIGRIASVSLRYLWILSQDSLENAAKGTWSPLVYDRTMPGGLLNDWASFPSAAPDAVLLPGLGAAAINHVAALGVFRIAGGLSTAGVPTAVISRWPVGGASTKGLLEETLTELPQAGLVDAWHRARALLWKQELSSSTEPLISQQSDQLIPGSDPKFWAGYIVVDGFRPQRAK